MTVQFVKKDNTYLGSFAPVYYFAGSFGLQYSSGIISVSVDSSFSLTNGAQVVVYFSTPCYTGAASSPSIVPLKLNVNNTGAIDIVYRNNYSWYGFKGGSVVKFIYYDSKWRIVNTNPGYTSFGDCFAQTAHTLDANSLAAGGIKQDTITATKTGCYPLMISGWHSSNRFLILNRCYFTAISRGSCTVEAAVYNPHSSAAASTAHITVYILWRRANTAI